MKLRFFFDPGSSICLWAADDEARLKYQYPIRLEMLPLSIDTVTLGNQLIAKFDTSLDWNDPGNPSPWNEAEYSAFFVLAKHLLTLMRAELGHEFELLDELNC